MHSFGDPVAGLVDASQSTSSALNPSRLRMHTT